MASHSSMDDRVLALAMAMARNHLLTVARMSRTILLWVFATVATCFAVPFLASRTDEVWHLLAGFIAVLALLSLVPSGILIAAMLVSMRLRSDVREAEVSVLELRLAVVEHFAQDLARQSPPEVRARVLAAHREELAALPAEDRNELIGVMA